MGFWGKVFGKEEKFEQVAVSPKEMNLEQIDLFIKDRINEISSPALKKGEELLKEIEKNIQSLENNIKILETSSPKFEKIDPELWSLASGNRIGLVKKMKEFVSSLSLPETISLDALSKYYSLCSRTLKEISNNSVKNFEYARTIFEEESFRILHDFKSIDRVLSSLGKVVEDQEILKLKKLESKVKEITEKTKLKSLKKKELEEIKNRIAGKIGLLESLEAKLNEIENSVQMKTYREMLTKSSLLRDDFEKTASEIKSKLSSLDRPLRKFKRILPENEKPELAKELDLYIEDPMNAFLNDSNFKILLLIIERVEKLILNGSLEMEEKKKYRTLQSLAELKDVNGLLELRKGFFEKESRIKKNDIEISKFNAGEEKNSLEKKIVTEKENLYKELNEREILDKYINDIGSSLNEIKKELEGDLQTIGSGKIEILLSSNF